MAHYLFIDTAGSRSAGKRGKHFIYLQLYFTKVIVCCRYLLSLASCFYYIYNRARCGENGADD